MISNEDIKFYIDSQELEIIRLKKELKKLKERLPKTKDGYIALPGDFLEPEEGVDYLCGMVGQPWVEMRAYYILDSGQHVTDIIANYNKAKPER